MDVIRFIKRLLRKDKDILFTATSSDEIVDRAKELTIELVDGAVFVYQFDVLNSNVKVRYIHNPTKEMLRTIKEYKMKCIYVKQKAS